MILEGIVTTQNADGCINIAPMGPHVDDEFSTLLLRPFQTSTTYQNLKRQPCGVFHVIDDARLLARAAIGCWVKKPETRRAEKIEGAVLTEACRWYEFEVHELNDREERTTIQTRVIHTGRLKDFFGWNRAKHAVLEAAILATRVHILPKTEIETQLAALRVPVDKTAGSTECEAFELLADYVRDYYAGAEH
ncbi:MAG: DUF447 family protein [Planctomycetaceae bacterium]|nr:DUF447 family protein [Planctomycetaceae bacterium]